MNLRLITLLLLASISTLGRAEILLVETFESGNMNSTNDAGFFWETNNRTSIVYSDGDINKVVWSNGTLDTQVNDGRDWSAFDQAHSLRFRYPAGDFMSEQRFQLGESVTDFWMSYWIRVPVNYRHGSGNNKFLSLWPNTYDRSGTVTWQTRPSSTGSNLVYQDGGVTDAETDPTPFINYGTDLGRWMHVVVNVKSASSSAANNGLIQFFRRWENENNYKLIHRKANSNTWDTTSTTQGISRGYLMGWANDPYNQDTEWLIDNVTFSSSPLIDTNTNPPQKINSLNVD